MWPFLIVTSIVGGYIWYREQQAKQLAQSSPGAQQLQGRSPATGNTTASASRNGSSTNAFRPSRFGFSRRWDDWNAIRSIDDASAVPWYNTR